MSEYTLLKNTSMDFGAALIAIETGASITRRSWTEEYKRIRYINLHEDVDFHLMEEGPYVWEPFFLIHTGDTHVAPWFPTQSDIVAKDWLIVYED